VVVFQANTGVGFAVILDEIVRRLKTFWETRVTHFAHERFGPWPLGAEAAPLSIIAPTVMRITRAVHGMRPFIPPASMTACWRLGASARVARLEVGQDLCR
jgi:hypothetical protein